MTHLNLVKLAIGYKLQPVLSFREATKQNVLTLEKKGGILLLPLRLQLLLFFFLALATL